MAHRAAVWSAPRSPSPRGPSSAPPRATSCLHTRRREQPRPWLDIDAHRIVTRLARVALARTRDRRSPTLCAGTLDHATDQLPEAVLRLTTRVIALDVRGGHTEGRRRHAPLGGLGRPTATGCNTVLADLADDPPTLRRHPLGGRPARGARPARRRGALIADIRAGHRRGHRSTLSGRGASLVVATGRQQEHQSHERTATPSHASMLPNRSPPRKLDREKGPNSAGHAVYVLTRACRRYASARGPHASQPFEALAPGEPYVAGNDHGPQRARGSPSARTSRNSHMRRTNVAGPSRRARRCRHYVNSSG